MNNFIGGLVALLTLADAVLPMRSSWLTDGSKGMAWWDTLGWTKSQAPGYSGI
jgi:hypothetical protein